MRHFQRLSQRGAVIARIIFQHHRGLIGEGVARDKVAPADLDAIDSEIARRDIHQPFQYEGRLRAAGAAIGVGWHGVGKNHFDLAIDRRGRVSAGEQRAIEVGRDVGPERRDVAADIRQRRHPQPEELAVPVKRQLGMGDMIAALRIGLESFAAIGNPFDRPFQLTRGPGHQCLLGIDDLLAAKAAADVRGHHAQLAFRYAEDQDTD